MNTKKPNSPDFNEELKLMEHLRRGEYREVERIIGDDSIKAKQVFRHYQTLKSIESMAKLDTLPTALSQSKSAAPVSEKESAISNASIREIVITTFASVSKEIAGITSGLRILSGQEFLSSTAGSANIELGVTRTANTDNSKAHVTDIPINGNFSFTQFNISTNKITSVTSAKNKSLDKIEYQLTVPQAERVKISELSKDRFTEGKTIYLGKRVKELVLNLPKGGYEVRINKDSWHLILS